LDRITVDVDLRVFPQAFMSRGGPQVTTGSSVVSTSIANFKLSFKLQVSVLVIANPNASVV